MDSCSNGTDPGASTDTTQPTDCSPLKGIENLANHLKSLKASPDEQILVAGIFGWPLNDADLAKAKYKIALTPSTQTNPPHAPVYDYWPVCYDPNHMPKASTTDATTGFDSEAAGFGATGGLRMDAFLKQFGSNGLRYSICQTSFQDSLKEIGVTLAKRLQNLCVDYKLIDTDLATPGVQADCRVVYQKLDDNGKYYEETNSMPQCDSTLDDDHQPTYDCWKLVKDWTKCDKLGQLITVVRPVDQRKNPQAAGTKVSMQCRTCVDVQGIDPIPECDYTPPH
jgi:hypothetical protein